MGTGMAMSAGMQDSANHERPRGWHLAVLHHGDGCQIELALLLPVRLSLPTTDAGALAF
jgi:hypothetical protein